MDSNEKSEDKSVEADKEMEVEEPKAQDESEKQPDDANMEKVVAEDDKTSESKDSTSEKPDDAENATAEPEKLEDEKINTPQNESRVAEAEKKEEKKPSEKVETAKETKIAKEDTRPPNPAVVLVAHREGKRKRKSTNPLPETSATSPPTQPAAATAEAAAAPAAAQQNGSATKRKKLIEKCDKYCWRCHKESVEAQCSVCPRSWHRRCMGGAPPLSTNDWVCGECVAIQEAESAESRPPAMADLGVEQLCMMLRHVVERMRDQHGSEPFWKAVDLDDVPNYLDYVVKPMDLSLLESNIRAKSYGSTDAFMADAKWIQHNCIVFNTYTSKLTNTAKQMLKVARQEVSEIETCPDCFARGRNLPRPLPSWFIEPCRRPHPIVWAKLKGFPFWPAKAMPRLNAQGLVDVRFFGEHDRAWVSPKDIYLYSREPPAMLPKKKKQEMEECVTEVEEHIDKLKDIVGEFRYAALKTPYDPHDPLQIKKLLPEYDPTKSIRKETTKTPTANKQQTPVQNSVNNKVTSPKTEKKPQNTKSTTTVASTNGIVEVSIEKRKLDRKRKAVDPVKEAVNKVTPEVPSEVVINNKGKSKSPPVTAVVTNNSISDNSNSSVSNSEPAKNSKSPEVSVIEVTNDSTPKKIITAAKKLKSDGMKKIKLTKISPKADIKKTIITPKSTNGKPTSLIKIYRPINNLQNSSDAANDVSPNKKAKTIFIQSKSQMAGSTAKIVPKAVLVEHKVTKVSQNSPNKEVPRIIVNNIHKISKDGTLINKPMTAIPIPARKDQVKAMFSSMNSSASETAKRCNEKDAKLNLIPIAVIKQEPKDDVPQPRLTITRSPGKARKSLPNKAPTFPKIVTPSTSRPLSKTNTSATPYIPSKSTEARASISVLPPPEAGPLTSKIHQGSKELANRMVQLIVNTIKNASDNSDLSLGNTVNSNEATIHMLKLKIEQIKWEHQQEIADLKHNHDLILHETKTGMEMEKILALTEAKREAEIERQRCIEETKRKQWCVVCGREAMFYCCWNTAYCDYPCQQKHWSSHIATCAQKSQKSNSSNTSSSQSQQSQKPVSETTANGQQNGSISDEIQTLSTGSV